ncbi:PriCT-2 domain-containing protein [Rhizobium sp. ZPR3]|uniref:PriCT-2 domain-containing protein n=2 Tax=unclassified Rhizobium TaxID=2613769 RepID=A0AAU7SC70_9HYPH
MDTNEATRFLKYLTHKNIHDKYVSDQDHLFQLYPEKGRDGLVPRKAQLGRLASSLKDFEKAQEDGYAIGVTVNFVTGNNRVNENVLYYRAVWHDDDGKGFNGDDLPEPTLVIETSPNRFHRYWFIDRSKGEMTTDEWTGIMGVMACVHGSDKGHPCQALRLPGSYHQKGERHRVEIVGGTENLYSVSELLEAFGTMADYGLDEVDGVRAAPIPVDWEQDRERIAKALKSLSSDSRDKWFAYGGAIHDACGGAIEGFRIWDDWSRTSEKYDPATQVEYWNKEFPKRGNASNKTGLGTIFRDAIEAGANPDNVFLLPHEEQQPEYDYIDFSTAKLDDDEFPKAVINEVRKTFDGFGHKPSEAHYGGLEDIAKTFHRMAGGALAPNFFLSALPCGMGKTTVVTECTKQLLDWPTYKNAGVIYFLSRIVEINTLVERMGLSKNDFAVLVSEGRQGDVKNHGNPEPTKARILFTTHEQLKRRLEGGQQFEEIDKLFYRGHPRTVRIWDETITPSMALTLERRKVGRLLDALASNGFGSLADELEEWALSIKGKKTGDKVEVPDVNSVVTDLQNFRDMFGDDDRDIAEALWRLSGHQARVRTENLPKEANGVITLDYEDNLPKDLTPMLILDASGELRKTYAFWEKYRKDLGGSLKFLRSPPKTYHGLTIHHWNKGAGKAASNDWKKAPEIAAGVITAINTCVPVGEEVLVIHHKPKKVKGRAGPDMENLVKPDNGLNPNAKVRFLTYGNHTATNEFAHVKHVVLAGILQYNEAQYEAYGRGAKKIQTDDEFSDNDLQSVRVGEIAHNIFQAACRGQVRKAENGDCPEGCHLWIIFPNDRKKGFSQNHLARVFPRAEIVNWEPFGKQLTGKAKEVLEHVQGVFAGNPNAELKVSDVRDWVEMQKPNFSRLINGEDMKTSLQAEGIELVAGSGRTGSYFRKVSAKSLPWETGTQEGAGL